MAIDDFKAEQYDRAVKHLTVALSLDEKSHVLFSNRCTAYIALDEYGKAMEDADECVRLQPSWAKGYLRRGSVYFRMGQLEKAESVLKVRARACMHAARSSCILLQLHAASSSPHPSLPNLGRTASSSTRSTTRSRRSSRRS